MALSASVSRRLSEIKREKHAEVRRLAGTKAEWRALEREFQATGRIRRNMPDPIPVMILGRLAVDKAFQSRGLGAALLRDSVLRTRQAADIVGVRAMLVHAISAEAKRFDERYGVAESPVDPMTLMLSLGDVDRIAAEK